MNNVEMIQHHISSSISTKLAVSEMLAEDISLSGQVITTALQQGNKILCCGNGGSASDAQHFAAELVGRYVDDRISLPGIALNTDTSAITSIGNDYGYDQVFSRQIQGLGRAKDVLIAITTSGNSENILQAVRTAHERELHVIALTGKKGGKLTDLLRPHDVHICVPSDVTAHIQEAHIMILHCWCAIIDHIYISNQPSMFKK